MNTLTIQCICPRCGIISVIRVNKNEYANYKNGILVQQAFPTMSIVDREKIISGLCTLCQKSLFSSDED